jgi:hypothetical protein
MKNKKGENEAKWIKKIGCVPEVGTRFKYKGMLCEVTWIEKKKYSWVQVNLVGWYMWYPDPLTGKLTRWNNCIERLSVTHREYKKA